MSVNSVYQTLVDFSYNKYVFLSSADVYPDTSNKNSTLETTKIEEVKESDYVVILDAPETPLNPAKPKKKLMVIQAGILGIGLGMVLAFVRVYAKNSDEEEQEKMDKVRSLILKNIIDFLPRRFKNN